MRIKQVAFVVAPGEVVGFLASWLKSDRVANLVVSTEDGLLRVRCTYRFGPFPLPVDLAIRVAGVGPDRLELAVIANGQLVQEALFGLLRSLRDEGIGVEGGRLLVRVDRLAARFGASLRLGGVAFKPEGIAVSAYDLAWQGLPAAKIKP